MHDSVYTVPRVNGNHGTFAVRSFGPDPDHDGDPTDNDSYIAFNVSGVTVTTHTFISATDARRIAAELLVAADSIDPVPA